jgi:integrase
MNAKTLSTLLGHTSVLVTYDVYGHLLQGTDAEACDLLDAYLDEHNG